MEREAGIGRDEGDGAAEAIGPAPGARRAERTDYLRAKADYAAGRDVAHVVVSEWLRTWGDADQRPFSDWLASRNG